MHMDDIDRSNHIFSDTTTCNVMKVLSDAVGLGALVFPDHSSGVASVDDVVPIFFLVSMQIPRLPWLNDMCLCTPRQV